MKTSNHSLPLITLIFIFISSISTAQESSSRTLPDTTPPLAFTSLPTETITPSPVIPTSSTTFQNITSIATLILAIAAIGTLFYTGKQASALKAQLKLTQQLAFFEFAQEIKSRENDTLITSTLKALGISMETPLTKENCIQISNHSNHELASQIVSQLNSYEALCTAIRNKTFDEELAYVLFQIDIVWSWNFYKNYIEYMREGPFPGGETGFQELQLIAEKWLQKQSITGTSITPPSAPPQNT